MSKATEHDAFATLAAAYVAASTAVTAGGSGDNTEVSGAYIDCQDVESITFLLPFTTTLGAGETLTIACNIQDATSSGGAGVADYGDAVAATVVATGETGGSTETGVAVATFDVSGANRYIRLQFTPNASASGTDTAAIQAVAILGGQKRNPPSFAGMPRLN